MHDADYYKDDPFMAAMYPKSERMVELIRNGNVTEQIFKDWFTAHVVAVGPVEPKTINPYYCEDDTDDIYNGIKNNEIDGQQLFVIITDLMDEAAEYAMIEDILD